MDQALDGVAGSSGDGATGSLSVRRGAAARRELEQALRKAPQHFYEHVEGEMHRAFTVGTDDGARPVSSREYLAYRARLGTHKPTTNWMWMIAGIHDALRRGAPEEARARAALSLVVGEQVALDNGWWPLAWELSLEEEPPYATISARGLESTRMPRPHTCEPRWAEVALSRLRDADDYAERRRRLGYTGGKGESKGPKKGKDGKDKEE